MALFLGFIVFSYFVAKERLLSIDFDTTVKIQDKLTRGVDYPFSLISVVGSVEVIAVVCIVLIVILLLKKYYWSALAIFLLPLALALEVYGKIAVEHPGPPHMFYRGVISYEFPSHYVQTDYSYPSGHTLRFAFVLFFLMTISYLKTSGVKRLVLIAGLGLLVLAVCVSRVYLGEHWFSDVVGGLLLGSSLGILAGSLVPGKRKKEGEGLAG